MVGGTLLGIHKRQDETLLCCFLCAHPCVLMCIPTNARYVEARKHLIRALCLRSPFVRVILSLRRSLVRASLAPTFIECSVQRTFG